MADNPQLDIFDSEAFADIGYRLEHIGRWPAQERFPVNLPSRSVGKQVLDDIAQSTNPLIVTGFASLGRIIALTGGLRSGGPAVVRLLFGSEPFETRKKSFVLADQTFPNVVREYWLERGISLHLSAELIYAIECIKEGRVVARYVESGRRPLHAKIYKTDVAVTVGSSNFTNAGLAVQLEANVRFERDSEKKRFAEAGEIAEHYWAVGQDYTSELLALLEQLLRVVPWEEALARACSELLEGAWASRYLSGQLDLGDTRLWPSQRSGIAQALWVLENIGSVLVADATGSGKTRMGAHLLRALRDRIWSSGRTRTDLCVLICPPSVRDAWEHEAVNCGLPLDPHSHGILSRKDAQRFEVTTKAVRRAQTLAVDEAHNFLNLGSSRTREVLSNMADNVVLFTATPINRGATDLLSLVDMLGADNLEEDALDVLEALGRRKGTVEQSLAPSDVSALRREIQRFTVRRTKKMLNALVDRDPGAFADAEGRQCRYPSHISQTYEPGESRSDRQLAAQIRGVAEELLGIALLEQSIELPEAYAADGWSDERFLRGRLSATRHLALHHVMSTLRSSRAALIEHLVGTVEAMRRFGIKEPIKQTSTGDTIGKLRERKRGGRPQCLLSCELPPWLSGDEAFAEACDDEIARYNRMLGLVTEMSSAREKTKAQKLCELIEAHRLVLAFDSHLISLEIVRSELLRARVEAEVVVATGGTLTGKKRVRKLLARGSEARAIALCSDSMSEGINLQGASAIMHLDMPSVVRIAEQRVGRVDRMDSPHAEIEAWWPDDSAEFAIRADDRFVERYQTVDALLGSNLVLPDEISRVASAPVSAQDMIRDAEEASLSAPWDGIQDAFSPVRALVIGERALVAPETYRAYVGVETRVLSRIGLVSSSRPWAFFAITGFNLGAPKWVLIEEAMKPVPIVRLDAVCEVLRAKLAGDIENRRMDDTASQWIRRFLKVLAESEQRLLPKRKQRALEQMAQVLSKYKETAARERNHKLEARWDAILQACRSTAEGERPDFDAVAEQWLDLVRPRWFGKLAERRRGRRPLLLKDIKRDLLDRPFEIEQIEERFGSIPTTPPLEDRIAACIIGVPG